MNRLISFPGLMMTLTLISPGIFAAQALTPDWVSQLVTGCEGTTSGLSASHIYYVTPTGHSSASGNSFQAALDFKTALNKAQSGEMILLQPGTYTIAYQEGEKNTLRFSRSGASSTPIKVVAANCGKAVFDFSFPEQAWVQNSYGFYVTGDYWYFKGIEITRAGYQGVYVTGKHNTFENCAFYKNRNTGFEINKGGAYTTVINSDAYRNYDPKKLGSMADGFGPKQTQGPGNAFYGCRAWENSDDGFDEYESDEDVVIKDSWAFRNGIDYWHYGNFSGNGNGFKLGGHGSLGHPRIVRSVAFGNPSKGFDQNNNAGGITAYNNTAYQNGINFGFGNPVANGQQHDLRNNISFSGSVSVANAYSSHNSWQNLSAHSSDFISLDLSNATVQRNNDGTLPYTPLFRLASGSQLINAGTDAGLNYLGSAPDLGAFESR
ncbi:right-handed parallel beta-helix repeat-containing protein [Celerinatantimonas sp. YJH-8]|uniref:right-handed parallel beta-helix repeat-containing protein n=1 Tax=Celerinatantimonas sp. YJH-8 TaxID=3228714 RepID=UPI0038C3AD40